MNCDCAPHTAFGSTGEASAQKNIVRKSADLLDTMQVVQTLRKGLRTNSLKFVNKNNGGAALMSHCNPIIEMLSENFLERKVWTLSAGKAVNLQLQF